MFSPRGLVLKVLVLALLVGAGSYLSLVRPSADVFIPQTGSYTFSSTTETEKSSFWERCDSKVIPSKFQNYIQGDGSFEATLSTDTLDISDGQPNSLTITLQVPNSYARLGSIGILLPNFKRSTNFLSGNQGKPLSQFLQSFSPSLSPLNVTHDTFTPGTFFRKDGLAVVSLRQATEAAKLVSGVTSSSYLSGDLVREFSNYSFEWYATGGRYEQGSIPVPTPIYLPSGAYELKIQVPDSEFISNSVYGQYFILVTATGYEAAEGSNPEGETLGTYLGAKLLPIRLMTAPQIELTNWGNWVSDSAGTYSGPELKPKSTDSTLRGSKITWTISGDAEFAEAPDTFRVDDLVNGVRAYPKPKVKPIGQGKSFALTAKVSNSCGANEVSRVYSYKESGESVLAVATPTATQSFSSSPTPTETTIINVTPTVTLTADPSEITAGEKTTLKWQSTNAAGVVESNFDTKDVSGEKQMSPSETTTYSVVVQGNQTTARAEAKVTVKPTPTPTPSETVPATPTTTVTTPAASSASPTASPTATATTQATKKATTAPAPASTPPLATETTSPPIDRAATISDTVQFVKVAGETKDLGRTVSINQGTPIQVGVVQGTAKPGETVTVTVYSEPKTYTVTADANGHWSLEIPTVELEAGEHRIEYETPTKPKAELMKFTVAAAAEPMVTPSVETTSVLPVATNAAELDSDLFTAESGSFLEALLGSLPWWVWAIVGLVIAVLIYLFLHTRKLASHNLHEPDDAMQQYPTPPPSGSNQS